MSQNMLRQIIFDTETTGLSPKEGHRVIEIGAVEIVNRRITGREFHAYINPEREVDAGAFAVHGLGDAFLADKPLFADVAKEFLLFVKDAELIAHNASFDVGFVNAEFARLPPEFGLIESHCKIVDTLMMARRQHPGQRNSLDALCKRYQVDLSGRQKHGALLDAHLLSAVYLALTSGQKSLLASAAAPVQEARAAETVTHHVTTQSIATPIVRANAQELEAHAGMVKEISQAGDDCLWDHQEAE